jgi:hypothetical protein
MPVGFAVVTSKVGVVLLFVEYGAFYAIDEGQTKGYVADLSPEASRATALGTNLGVSLLCWAFGVDFALFWRFMLFTGPLMVLLRSPRCASGGAGRSNGELRQEDTPASLPVDAVAHRSLALVAFFG